MAEQARDRPVPRRLFGPNTPTCSRNARAQANIAVSQALLTHGDKLNGARTGRHGGHLTHGYEAERAGPPV